MSNNQQPSSAWMSAFLPLGIVDGQEWAATGGGVLLIDQSIVWLVTARQVVESLRGRDLSAWVPRQQGPGLLNITDSQRAAKLDWVHHPVGLSATMFPVDPNFGIKAFADKQCSKVRDLQPMQPCVSIGSILSADAGQSPNDPPAVCDGIISSSNAQTGQILATAPLLPNNAGGPLLLASPYGGAVTLAGIVLGNLMLNESDPRVMPVRLTKAICIDAALELIRGQEATAQRNKLQQEANAQAKVPEPTEQAQVGAAPPSPAEPS